MKGPWRVRAQLADVMVSVEPAGSAVGDADDRLLRAFLWEARDGGRRDVERVLVDVYEELYGAMPCDWESARHDVGRRARVFERVAQQLRSALRSGVLRLRDARPPSVIVRLEGVEEDVLGPEAVPSSWIEIELVDGDGNPVPDAAYALVTSDGRTRSGTLDARGFAREEGIAAGDCKVSFPKLHDWKAA
jgi:hypothetical protein